MDLTREEIRERLDLNVPDATPRPHKGKPAGGLKARLARLRARLKGRRRGRGVWLGWERGKVVGQTKTGKPIYAYTGTGPDKGQTRKQHAPPGSRGKGQAQAGGSKATPAQLKKAAGRGLVTPEEAKAAAKGTGQPAAPKTAQGAAARRQPAPPAPKGWEPPLGSTPGPALSPDGSRGGVHPGDAKKAVDAVKDVFSLGSVAEWGLAPAGQLHQQIQQRTGRKITPEAFRGFLKRAEEMRALDWHITNETGQVTGDKLANQVAAWNANGGVQNELSVRSYGKLADAWRDYASRGGVSPPAAGDTPPGERASGLNQSQARARARKQAGLT